MITVTAAGVATRHGREQARSGAVAVVRLRLPDRYREWVVRDNTAPNWRLRYALHITVRTLPFLIGGFFLVNQLPEVTWPMALGAMIVALAFTLYFTLTSAGEFRNVRLVQHGIPPARR
jgi:hypothetical protein